MAVPRTALLKANAPVDMMKNRNAALLAELWVPNVHR